MTIGTRDELVHELGWTDERTAEIRRRIMEIKIPPGTPNGAALQVLRDLALGCVEQAHIYVDSCFEDLEKIQASDWQPGWEKK